MGLIHYKQLQVNGLGQPSNMQARSLISRLSNKLNHYVSRYQHMRKAVLAAYPDSAWESKYQPLTKEDVRAPTIANRSLGSGQQELSWIWRVQQQDCRDLPG